MFLVNYLQLYTFLWPMIEYLDDALWCKSFIFNQQFFKWRKSIIILGTILRDLSCSLICLPWNIHMDGQYSNCDSIKALKRIRLFLNRRNLATLVKSLSFLLAFEQIFDTCLSNFRLLSTVIPRSLTSLLS